MNINVAIFVNVLVISSKNHGIFFFLLNNLLRPDQLHGGFIICSMA